MNRRLAEMKRWWMEPFTMKVDIYEHTRVEHRAFPYRLRVQRVDSVQDMVDRGGVVTLPRAVIHVTEPLIVPAHADPPVTIIDCRFQGHGASSVIEIPGFMDAAIGDGTG